MHTFEGRFAPLRNVENKLFEFCTLLRRAEDHAGCFLGNCQDVEFRIVADGICGTHLLYIACIHWIANTVLFHQFKFDTSLFS